MKNWLEIRFWRVARHLILKGYGADCATKDTDDLPVANGSRCPSCEAREIVEWIDRHIELLK